MFEEHSYPWLLDGGLSNQLENQGCDLNNPLWTASLIQTDPESIINAHLAYLEAGAQCIITSSYQATIPGFLKLGYPEEEAEELIKRTVSLAEEALKRFMNANPQNLRPLIAASIGPYGAYLADGSEYRGNYGVEDSVLRDFHRSRIELLDTTSADLLSCETIPSLQEARILSEILMNVNKPAWVSFSCKDEIHINDGSKLSEAIQIFNRHPSIFAVGINCTHPDFISELIKTTKANCEDKRVIVYPNSGEEYHADSKSWGSKNSGMDTSRVEEWLKLGVDIIGGCCRIGPAQIREMERIIRKFHHK